MPNPNKAVALLCPGGFLRAIIIEQAVIFLFHGLDHVVGVLLYGVGIPSSFPIRISAPENILISYAVRHPVICRVE